MLPSYLPSPSQGVWHLGPVPVRAYALCILAGIVIAVAVTDRRWRARGGLRDQVADIALWAVPLGIVGARLYSVVTTPDPYFGAGGDPVSAFYIWRGGLGIWGGVAGGALGAWIGCRRAGARFGAFADAMAPGLVLAQAVGRFGNWFNQELYGRPSTLPWALRIDPAHREDRYADVATYQPTFLYEALWDVGTAVVLLTLGRRLRFGHGRVFFLYVVLYTAGRSWVELLRIDPAEQVLGLRLNVWTCILVFCAGLVALVTSARRSPEPVEDVLLPGARAQAAPPAEDAGTGRVDVGSTRSSGSTGGTGEGPPG